MTPAIIPSSLHPSYFTSVSPISVNGIATVLGHFFLLHFLQESSPESLPMKASCIMTGLNTDIFFGQLDSK